MVFLGILLAGAAVGVAIGIVAENSTSASLSVFGQHIPGIASDGQVFVAGVVVTIFLVIGLLMATLSMGRSMRVRRELRDLRDERNESLTALEAEKKRLQRELARARSDTAGVPAPGDVHVASRQTRDPLSPFFDQSA
jgi:hypothetical protein